MSSLAYWPTACFLVSDWELKTLPEAATKSYDATTTLPKTHHRNPDRAIMGGARNASATPAVAEAAAVLGVFPAALRSCERWTNAGPPSVEQTRGD